MKKQVIIAIVGLILSILGYFIVKNYSPINRSLEVNESIRYYEVPVYTIVYNISEFINTTIYDISHNKTILLLYSSKRPGKYINYTYELARVYNATIYLYDIEKPWFGLKLSENVTLPLVPLMPIPSLLCVNNNKAYILIGEQLEDKQNIILLMDKCLK